MCRIRTRSKREASSQNLTRKTSHMLNIPYHFLNGFELISKMTRGSSQSEEICQSTEKSHVWYWQLDNRTSAAVLPLLRATQKGSLVRPHSQSPQLYGSLGDLRCTASFIKETGVSSDEREEEEYSMSLILLISHR